MRGGGTRYLAIKKGPRPLSVGSEKKLVQCSSCILSTEFGDVVF